MADLEELYREIILDHYRSPRNRGELASPPAHRVEGFNPLCGDEVVVTFTVDDGKVTDIKWAGRLLDQPVLGLPHVRGGEGQALDDVPEPDPHLQVDDVDPRGVVSAARARRRRRGRRRPVDLDKLGSSAALQGVVKFPVRIKCATLSWNALAQGLDEIETAAGSRPAAPRPRAGLAGPGSKRGRAAAGGRGGRRGRRRRRAGDVDVGAVEVGVGAGRRARHVGRGRWAPGLCSAAGRGRRELAPEHRDQQLLGRRLVDEEDVAPRCHEAGGERGEGEGLDRCRVDRVEVLGQAQQVVQRQVCVDDDPLGERAQEGVDGERVVLGLGRLTRARKKASWRLMRPKSLVGSVCHCVVA